MYQVESLYFLQSEKQRCLSDISDCADTQAGLPLCCCHATKSGFSRQGHSSDSCNDYIDNQRLEETITELNEANQNDGPKPTI